MKGFSVPNPQYSPRDFPENKRDTTRSHAETFSPPLPCSNLFFDEIVSALHTRCACKTQQETKLNLEINCWMAGYAFYRLLNIITSRVITKLRISSFELITRK